MHGTSLIALGVLLATALFVGLVLFAGRPSSATGAPDAVDVDVLLGLPNAAPVALQPADLIGLFVSSVGICAEALNDVEDYRLIFEGSEKPTVVPVYLLLEDDDSRSEFFAETRRLSMPVLFRAEHSTRKGLLGERPSGLLPSRAAGGALLPGASAVPTLFLLDSKTGRILGRQGLGTYRTPPAVKSEIWNRFVSSLVVVKDQE